MPVRMIAAVQVALIFLSPNSSMTQTIPAHGCVSYEPSHVTLQGTLVRKTFPGPPNYESVKNGDKPQTSWILELQESICVDEDKAQPDLNPQQSRIREVQLVLPSQQFAAYKHLVGRRVTATGTMFGGITAHHHTPVLLTVLSLKEAQRNNAVIVGQRARFWFSVSSSCFRASPSRPS